MPVARPSDRRPAHPLFPGLLVEGKLGAGGGGTVFAAVRAEDRARVAIKSSAPGPLAAQLDREAEALAAVGPPLVPRLHLVSSLPGGTRYLVMERIELPTLQQILLAARGPLPAAQFKELAGAVVAALAQLHARGFVHLDLKPENVFIAPQGQAARLVDLGLARRKGEARLPQADAFAGTPESMAPEQCEGKDDLDARADVYAAGVTLFRMLCGRPPFLGTAGEVKQAHLAQRPPRPSLFAEVPAAVEEVVLRCLAKERDRRFADGAELSAPLQAALQAAEPAQKKAQAAPASTPAATPRRPMALLHLLAEPSPILRAAIEASGGQLAHAEPRRCVAAFPADAIDHPLQRALRAAHELMARQLVKAALVDLQPVAVLQKPGKPARYLSTAFAPPGPLLAGDAGQNLLSTAAHAALPHLPASEVRPGVFRLADGALAAPAELHTQVGVSGALVGRAGELEALVAHARAALMGAGPGVAAVVGDPGVGKSRVAAELLARLRELDAQGLEVAASEPVAGQGPENLRRLLQLALKLPPGFAPADHGRAHLEAALGGEAALWPGAALALGLLPADHEAVQSLAQAPGALRSLMVRACGELLASRAEKRPLWIVVDDAHLLDDAALDALELAALAERRARLWVCALGRTSLIAGRPRLGERSASPHRLELQPLAPAESEALCRQLLAPAENLPQAALQLLVERTQGLPLLLVELVRGLKRDGVVKRAPGGGWVLLTDQLHKLPDLPLIEWLAQRELLTLPGELAAHARLCALMGPEVTLDEIEGVLQELERDGGSGDLPLDARVAARRLVSQGLLKVSAQKTYSFRHALVRDAVEGSIPLEAQRRVHAAALRFYRAAANVPEERRLPLLARHADRAGERALASSLYRELAERARARHAYFDAEQAYSKALDALDEGDQPGRLQAHRGRALMRYRIGRTSDALADFSTARGLAQALHDAAAEFDVLLDKATALDWMNDYARSRSMLTRARELLGDSAPTAATSARLLAAEGRSLYREAKREEACAALREAAARAAEAGDEAYESRMIALVLLAHVEGESNRLAAAEAACAEAMALAESHGDLLHLGSAINNRRMARIARRDAAGAVDDQQKFMRLARTMGLLVAEYVAHVNLGELLYYAGDLAQAEEHARRAQHLEATHPEFAARPTGALLVARVLTFAGRLDEAAQALQDARARVAESGAPLAPSEDVLARLVELSLAPARASDADWSALLERSARDSVEQEPLEALELHAHALLRAGRATEGRAALQAALTKARAAPCLIDRRIAAALDGLT